MLFRIVQLGPRAVSEPTSGTPSAFLGFWLQEYVGRYHPLLPSTKYQVPTMPFHLLFKLLVSE